MVIMTASDTIVISVGNVLDRCYISVIALFKVSDILSNTKIK